MKRSWIIGVLALAAVPTWANGKPVDPWEEPVFEAHGFIQNQTGIFISPDKNATATCTRCEPKEDFPSGHGNKLGRLSMLRNTFQIETDWRPLPQLSLHATFRGVLSAPLSVDRDAQVPEPGYLQDPDKRVRWVHENFYNEADLREFYFDIKPLDILSFRIGRQLVSWGESGNYRLLDVINPTNASWHFGPLENWEDNRVPLWMLRALLEIPAMQGGLEVVWVPMVPFIERPEDTVTFPLTFVGAWGLPPPPMQGDVSVMPRKIHKKHFKYPEQHPKNSRVGVRWKGEIGNHFGYTLAYYYGHQLSPPIPEYYVTSTDFTGVDVYVGYPRQHQIGFAIETDVPFPASTFIRIEGLIEPDRSYPVSSLTPQRLEPDPDFGNRFVFASKKELTINYAITIQQPAIVRFLNPDEPLIIALQFQHTIVPGVKNLTESQCGNPSLGFCLLDVPGYDSTRTRKYSYRLSASIFTTYLNGLLTPRIVVTWLPSNDWEWRSWARSRVWLPVSNSGFVSAQLAISPGDHWRIDLAVTGFWGNKPYHALGLFADRG
ncbi:MAG: hypothetical protein GXP54_07955 [Deltaproteobacteria bacterium]|nr:hypothetical protein [Deltaproteobacteria bacterium]